MPNSWIVRLILCAKYGLYRQNPVLFKSIAYSRSCKAIAVHIYSQLNCPPFLIVFYQVSRYHQQSYRVGGHLRVATKWWAKATQIENSQMASTGAISTSTYHKKQQNLWLNSSASGVVNYSQLSSCQGEMEPFEGDSSTREHPTSLRNKPQHKQLSAKIHG